MFKVYDGRDHFYQWDLNRKLIVGDTVKEVHFCNRTDNCSLVCETYTNEDGLILVDVPNILLQTDWKINVYAYDGLCTKHDGYFDVVSRSKPADYVYTETEVKRYEDLEARVEALEAAPGGGGEVDLSNYYTKEEVDNKLNDTKLDVMDSVINNFVDFSALESILMEGYYTKEAVDMKDEQLLGSIQVAENEINTLFGEVLRLEEEIGAISDVTTAIIALQNKYIGGETV